MISTSTVPSCTRRNLLNCAFVKPLSGVDPLGRNGLISAIITSSTSDMSTVDSSENDTHEIVYDNGNTDHISATEITQLIAVTAQENKLESYIESLNADWITFENNKDAFWTLHPLVGKVCQLTALKSPLTSQCARPEQHQLLLDHLRSLAGYTVPTDTANNRIAIQCSASHVQLPPYGNIFPPTATPGFALGASTHVGNVIETPQLFSEISSTHSFTQQQRIHAMPQPQPQMLLQNAGKAQTHFISELAGNVMVKRAPGVDHAGRPNLIVSGVTRVYRSPSVGGRDRDATVWMADIIYDNGAFETCTAQAAKKLLKLTIKENRYQRVLDQLDEDWSKCLGPGGSLFWPGCLLLKRITQVSVPGSRLELGLTGARMELAQCPARQPGVTIDSLVRALLARAAAAAGSLVPPALLTPASPRPVIKIATCVDGGATGNSSSSSSAIKSHTLLQSRSQSPNTQPYTQDCALTSDENSVADVDTPETTIITGMDVDDNAIAWDSQLLSNARSTPLISVQSAAHQKTLLNAEPGSASNEVGSSNDNSIVAPIREDLEINYRLSRGFVTLSNGTVMRSCDSCHRHRAGVEHCRFTRRHTAPNWDDLRLSSGATGAARVEEFTIPWTIFHRIDGQGDTTQWQGVPSRSRSMADSVHAQTGAFSGSGSSRTTAHPSSATAATSTTASVRAAAKQYQKSELAMKFQRIMHEYPEGDIDPFADEGANDNDNATEAKRWQRLEIMVDELEETLRKHDLDQNKLGIHVKENRDKLTQSDGNAEPTAASSINMEAISNEISTGAAIADTAGNADADDVATDNEKTVGLEMCSQLVTDMRAKIQHARSQNIPFKSVVLPCEIEVLKFRKLGQLMDQPQKTSTSTKAGDHTSRSDFEETSEGRLSELLRPVDAEVRLCSQLGEVQEAVKSGVAKSVRRVTEYTGAEVTLKEKLQLYESEHNKAEAARTAAAAITQRQIDSLQEEERKLMEKLSKVRHSLNAVRKLHTAENEKASDGRRKELSQISRTASDIKLCSSLVSRAKRSTTVYSQFKAYVTFLADKWHQKTSNITPFPSLPSSHLIQTACSFTDKSDTSNSTISSKVQLDWEHSLKKLLMFRESFKQSDESENLTPFQMRAICEGVRLARSLFVQCYSGGCHDNNSLSAVTTLEQIEATAYPKNNKFLNGPSDIDGDSGGKIADITIVLCDPRNLKHASSKNIPERSLRIIRILNRLLKLQKSLKAASEAAAPKLDETDYTMEVSENIDVNKLERESLALTSCMEGAGINYSATLLKCLYIDESSNMENQAAFREALALSHSEDYMTFLRERCSQSLTFSDHYVSSSSRKDGPNAKINFLKDTGFDIDDDESLVFGSEADDDEGTGSVNEEDDEESRTEASINPLDQVSVHRSRSRSSSAGNRLGLPKTVIDGILNYNPDFPPSLPRDYEPADNDRVMLWDALRSRRVNGQAAPLYKSLRESLMRNPHFTVYVWQDGKDDSGETGSQAYIVQYLKQLLRSETRTKRSHHRLDDANLESAERKRGHGVMRNRETKRFNAAVAVTDDEQQSETSEELPLTAAMIAANLPQRVIETLDAFNLIDLPHKVSLPEGYEPGGSDRIMLWDMNRLRRQGGNASPFFMNALISFQRNPHFTIYTFQDGRNDEQETQCLILTYLKQQREKITASSSSTIDSQREKPIAVTDRPVKTQVKDSSLDKHDNTPLTDSSNTSEFGTKHTGKDIPDGIIVLPSRASRRRKERASFHHGQSEELIPTKHFKTDPNSIASHEVALTAGVDGAGYTIGSVAGESLEVTEIKEFNSSLRRPGGTFFKETVDGVAVSGPGYWEELESGLCDTTVSAGSLEAALAAAAVVCAAVDALFTHEITAFDVQLHGHFNAHRQVTQALLETVAVTAQQTGSDSRTEELEQIYNATRKDIVSDSCEDENNVPSKFQHAIPEQFDSLPRTNCELEGFDHEPATNVPDMDVDHESTSLYNAIIGSHEVNTEVEVNTDVVENKSREIASESESLQSIDQDPDDFVEGQPDMAPLPYQLVRSLQHGDSIYDDQNQQLINSSWTSNYEALLDLCEKEGNGNVPFKYTQKSTSEPHITLKLGRWLCDQRSLRRKNALDPSRSKLMQLLVDGGMISWDMRHGAWTNNKISQLTNDQIIQLARSKLRDYEARLITQLNEAVERSRRSAVESRSRGRNKRNGDDDSYSSDEDIADMLALEPDMMQGHSFDKNMIILDEPVTIRGIRNAFCCIRPPGHHAGRYGSTRGCTQNGFCLLNNVAIAVHYARIKYGSRRVAVVDIDAHFGNGTAEILEGDPHAFYASIHLQLENINNPFFPSSSCCLLGCDTDEPNRVFVNIYPPQPRVPTGVTSSSNSNTGGFAPFRRRGREGFREAFDRVVLPRLKQFAPDLIFLSSGFDGAATDPVGGDLGLLPEDFNYVAREVQAAADSLCHGRVISVLEGGYDVRSRTDGLASSAEAHIHGLMKKR